MGMTPKQKQQFVRDARRKLGVTQATMAQAMGVSNARIVRTWESGTRVPQDMAIELIKHMLRRPGDFFEFED